MQKQFTLTMFTPREAERITGLTAAMQRDWRRRGFLAANDGHARFGAFEIAEMWAMKLLADRGIGPAHGKEVAGWLACGIVYVALTHIEAFEGDIEMVAMAGAASWHSAEDRVTEGVLARQVLRWNDSPAGSGKVVPARYFIWLPNGDHIWHASVDEAFLAFNEEALAGPLVVLDQVALGRRLLSLANRSLVHIEADQ